MSTRTVCALVITMLLVGVTAARAQGDAMGDAVTEYEEWMKVIAEFTRGIEFGEKDIQAVIEYWPEMNELEIMQEDDSAEVASEFARDVRQILADSEYQQWARSRGLEPEDFLRGSMRISMVFMAQQMESQQEMLASQQASYKAMVEQSCAQVDSETCAQMQDAMEQSFAIGEAMQKATKQLPPPTAAELKLLEQYGSDLEAAMMSDDEGYEDYDSDYEDYEYEDDDG
jgi:hypothetical protein